MKKTRQEDYEEIIISHRKIEEINLQPFIAAKELVKDFEIGDYIVRAVDHLSIEISEHEYVAIIGSSGAGKTTLVHILGGLETATKGDTFISHINVSHMEQEMLATFRIFNVGIVFQNYNLISSLTALENIMFPMQLCGVKHEECESRAKELLKIIGLAERSEHLPFQLSAGEQQRVAVARALANDPPIIIADEPTANLDKKNAEYIGELFENFRTEGKTIIVATHDEKLIKHAHRILIMEEGKIIEDKRINEISFKKENIEIEMEQE
ncbi:ABC transporter ATP-binding protein [Promethearchaeum syntrophicum]|uniref:ABC transporter ATP-binding protein n=1 Tax=Promethearchaeum syntrophicum TaxID=2594042 RepID=A0A5B9DFI3_9ARCH|nr:ABC transporter ATP-binding protein [Candidatus Prometheoarchaeum syntrophicum]QEE17467.1 putative ABC transporter ATP-binding protein [Candidatus Prometheoarchaeum syntrophicum]